jgi:hypothetical protein
MEMPDISATLSSATHDVNQWLGEQEWFQQIKAKWDELDPQSRTYLQFASAGMGFLLVVYIVFSFIWGVHSLHQEVIEKSALLSQIDSANDELRKLRSVNSDLSGASATGASDASPWAPYFQAFASQIGLAPDAVTVSDAKPGTTNELSKETLYDISIKKVNVHQMVRFAYALESGSRPVKLRNLVINTEADLSGYLDATLSVSAFTMLSGSTSGK